MQSKSVSSSAANVTEAVQVQSFALRKCQDQDSIAVFEEQTRNMQSERAKGLFPLQCMCEMLFPGFSCFPETFLANQCLFCLSFTGGRFIVGRQLFFLTFHDSRPL